MLKQHQFALCMSLTSLLVGIYSPSVKFFSTTSAGFELQEEKGLYAIALLLLVAEFFFNISMFEFNHQVTKKFHRESGVLDLGLVSWIFVSQYIEFESAINMEDSSRRTSGSALQIFEMKERQLFEYTYPEKGVTKVPGTSAFAVGRRTLEANFWPKFLTYALISAMALAMIVITCIFWKCVIKSCEFNIPLLADEDEENKAVVSETEVQEKKRKMPKSQNIFFKNWIIGLVSIVFTAFYVIYFIVYLAFPPGRYNQMDLYTPPSWFFWKSGFYPVISEQEEKKAQAYYRSKFELPEGMDWLDERENAVFPLVFGPEEVVKAYNKDYTVNHPHTYTPEAARLPNIVLVALESFIPSPYYYNDDYIQRFKNSKPEIVTGELYNKSYLPNLLALQKEGVACSGMTSESLPTNGGLFSLLSGAFEENYGLHIINDQYNDLDDFPSYFRGETFYSQFIAPSPLEFDGKAEYGFRGEKRVYGPKFLSKLPRWFDAVHEYFPTEKEFKELGIEACAPQRWTNDRITGAELVHYFKEQYEKESTKPQFVFWHTVDMHQPFEGYDEVKFYKETFGNGLDGGYGYKDMNDRYSTLQKYTDEQLGKVIEEIKKIDDNTIIAVTGDHGAFKIESYVEHNDIRDGFVVDENCIQGPYGNDEEYTTSGVLAYLGKDPYWTDIFDPVKGKIFTKASEHADLIFTLEKLVADFRGVELITARQGRNIFDLVDPDAKKLKYYHLRNTNYAIEVADEDSLVRSAYLEYQKGIIIPNVRYPTCISGYEEETVPLTLEEFNKHVLVSAWFSKLARENRLFNYAFRDTSCVKDDTCKFPSRNKAYNTPVVWNAWLSIPLGIMGFGIIISISLYYWSKDLNKKYIFIATKHGFKKELRPQIGTEETAEHEVNVAE